MPALSSQDSRLLNYKKPVLVVTESATQNLQPSFISAALTTGNVMVSQPASVRAAYNAEEIGQTLLSVDARERNTFTSRSWNVTSMLRI